MRAWVDVKPAERTGLRAHVINDANAAVLAERRNGAVQATAQRRPERLGSRSRTGRPRLTCMRF
jgi:hypothetical protein